VTLEKTLPGVLAAGIRVFVTEKHAEEGLSRNFVRDEESGNDTAKDADNQAGKRRADYPVSAAETIWPVSRSWSRLKSAHR
jgi:hypothetical protein